eukprot:6449458-Pyramimonas_sp.AAC.1
MPHPESHQTQFPSCERKPAWARPVTFTPTNDFFVFGEGRPGPWQHSPPRDAKLLRAHQGNAA